MVVGHGHVARPIVDHRQRKAFGEFHQQRHGAGLTAGARRDDQGVARARQDRCRLRDGIRVGRRGGRRLLRRFGGERRAGRGQYLARQRQVDRSLRLARGDGQGAVKHGFQLRTAAQFVIPLHMLAHHAGLVEHFLRPVDIERAAARLSGLEQRRAPRRQEHGHVLASGVDEAAQRIGGANIDMHHQRLRAPAHHGRAVGHADRDVLVRHEQGFRHGEPVAPRACQPLHQGRKIGAGVGEQKINAAARQQAQEALADAGHVLAVVGAVVGGQGYPFALTRPRQTGWCS